MYRRFALFIGSVALVACGCASAPHPLLRAFAPENLRSTIAGSTKIEARVEASAIIPFIPSSHALLLTKDGKTVIVLRPPFNTKGHQNRVAGHFRAQGQDVAVVIDEPKDIRFQVINAWTGKPANEAYITYNSRRLAADESGLTRWTDPITPLMTYTVEWVDDTGIWHSRQQSVRPTSGQTITVYVTGR